MEVGIFMAKYSYEFKKQIVMEYLEGRGGIDFLTSQYELGTSSQLRRWVAAYKEFGDKGLMRSRQRKNYSFEKKLSVVEYYLSNEISYQELAIREGIPNPCLIAIWVSRFRAAGLEGLRSHKKGRKKTLEKPKTEPKTQDVEGRTVDTSAQHVKELEDELLKLRIENAFLKELRRLRLEDEAKMRERHSSSTVSEENSN